MPSAEPTPCYLSPDRRTELADRVRQARDRLSACRMCPRACGIDRRTSQGDCRVGRSARLLAYIPAYQEEVTIVGTHGSGAIIFAGGELRKPGAPLNEQRYLGSPVESSAREVSAAELAGCMLDLQAAGCHNINLVNPSHVVAHILEALEIAVEGGLHLPLVYNSNGYDSLDSLALLDGLIDIYVPEMRFAYTRQARRFLVVDDYPRVNRAALREMHRQVGDLALTEAGLAAHGLLVRHVILPNALAGTTYVVRFLARQISPDTYLHLVDDYRPTRSAKAQRDLYRKITPREYECAKELAGQAGLHRFGRAALVERGPAIVV